MLTSEIRGKAAELSKQIEDARRPLARRIAARLRSIAEYSGGDEHAFVRGNVTTADINYFQTGVTFYATIAKSCREESAPHDGDLSDEIAAALADDLEERANQAADAKQFLSDLLDLARRAR